MGLAETFKVLSDPQRREILELLKNGRMNAGEIAEKLEITPAALSYHLKLMKKADLIMEYKEKNFIYYEIQISVFDEMILWVNQFGGCLSEKCGNMGNNGAVNDNNGGGN